MVIKFSRFRLLASVMTLACLDGMAWAQSASGQVAEVTVTAQKRKEKLQNVPIAVTAVTPAQLQNAGITQLSDLGKVAPGYQVTQAIGIYAEPVLRSVGTSSHGPGIENPIATYVDGVYFMSATSTLMSLYDIDQIAVLKGPQGTLFGRNATGGLVQITTKTPTHDFHADIQATIGNMGTYNEALYVNGGITPTLAGNFAVSHDVQGQGFGHNLYNGEYIGTFHDLAMRGKLLWQPDGLTDITLSADYSHREGSDIDTRPLGLTITGTKPTGGWFDVDEAVQPQEYFHGGGTSLNFKRDFDLAQLVSITAYRTDYAYNDFNGNDSPTPSIEIAGPEMTHQFSEELQLLSQGNERLSWAAGLYYLDASARQDPFDDFIYANQFFSDHEEIFVNSKVQSYAAFGQATYKLDPSTNVTAGIRYTADLRSIDSSQYDDFLGSLNAAGQPVFNPAGMHFTAADSERKTFAEPSARLSIDHRFSPEWMVYASYNHGFRSGSFDPNVIPAPELKPETLDAFEAGFKSDLLDHKLRFNASTYYYLYKNRQVQSIISGIEYDYDAAKATSYGIDADLTTYLTSQFSLTGGLSAIHAVYTSFPNAFITSVNPACVPGNCASVNLVDTNGSATGKFIENTPVWTLNLTPSYVFPTSIGDITLTAAYYHNGGWYADPDNRVKQNPYDTLAANADWVPAALPQLEIKLWGKNITNTHYATQIQESNSADNANVAPGATYGVTLSAHL